MQTSSGGVQVILKTLQVADGPELVSNLTSTLDCLARRRYTERLVRRGVVPVVLSSMVSSARSDWCNDCLLHLYHSLLLQLASKDKHLPVKARLSGALPVTVGLLKRSHGDHTSLHALLGLLKILATSSANALFMGKHGCLSVLSKLLEGVAKKNYIILKLCAESLTQFLKQKTLCGRASGRSCVGQLVALHQHCHLTDRQGRHLSLRRSVLLSLKAATSSAAGASAFRKCGGLEVLHSTASQFHSANIFPRVAGGSKTRERVKDDRLVINLPSHAYGAEKQRFEGNYTCHAFNVAGSTRMETHITLFGGIHVTKSVKEFGRRYADIYNQLRKSVSEHFPGVHDGERHLVFLTTGRVLSYEDFDPGYLYDESEESVLPQTMENMFDLVDIVPDGGSIVFNPHRAPRLQQTYSQLVDLLQAAPSSLSEEEHNSTRRYFQEIIRDPSSGQTLPRLSLYLLYKNMYYTTKREVDDLIESKRQGILGWEFTQWYERNIHTLQMKIKDAYTKWEMYADKKEVEERLETLNLEDHSQEISGAQALLLASQRRSRFKDEKQFYLVKLYPDTWYNELKNQVKESIEQMQFQLSKLKTEVQLLQLTRQYLEKKTRERDFLRALIPSLDPVYKLYRDLDQATNQLQELVKESEDMRYECLISGNIENCNLYWGMQEHIREKVMGNYTEFYWYVHMVEAALNHREFSIPAIATAISKLEVKIIFIQASINIVLSEVTDGDGEEATDNRDFFANFIYSPNPPQEQVEYDFSLPSSLLGRLLWYINPESTRLLPKELTEEYNLTINHLNTALTNVSAKLSRVNVHRRWFKAGLFGSKHLILADSDVAISPGKFTPPQHFREILQKGTYQLPLYPTTLLLATDIQLTVDVPFIFHTLPTLIKLSYDPHVTGGFGPFTFGPPHRASAGDMKFRVGIRDSKISITLPGTQLVGYVCDVVPQHPRQTTLRGHRSIHSTHPDTLVKESEFDQWLFSRNKNRDLNLGLFHKHPYPTSLPTHDTFLTGSSTQASEKTPMIITPTAPYHNTTL